MKAVGAVDDFVRVSRAWSGAVSSRIDGGGGGGRVEGGGEAERYDMCSGKGSHCSVLCGVCLLRFGQLLGCGLSTDVGGVEWDGGAEGKR